MGSLADFGYSLLLALVVLAKILLAIAMLFFPIIIYAIIILLHGIRPTFTDVILAGLFELIYIAIIIFQSMED